MNNKHIKIRQVLKELGIPAHILGHKYLIKAIQLVLEQPEYYRTQITKSLYPDIAEHFGDTTKARVERAIRHAVEVSYDNLPAELISKFFGNTIAYYKAKPCNSHFIYTVVEYLNDNDI